MNELNQDQLSRIVIKGFKSISIICTTKRTLTKKYKGGVSSYGKIKKELVRLCSEH